LKKLKPKGEALLQKTYYYKKGKFSQSLTT